MKNKVIVCYIPT